MLKQGVDRSLTDRLVHTQNQAGGLHGSLDGIDLDQAGLPHKSNHVVPHTLIVKVHAGPHIALAVLHPQPVQNVRGVEARIVAKLTRDHLQRLGKGLDHSLLLVRDIAVGEAMQVARQLHLGGTSSGDNGGVAQSTLDDHNSIVQTALHLGNKLLSATTQHQSTSLGTRALGEKVEALSTYLALLERAAGTQVAVLDVTASRLGRGTGGLAHPVHVIGRNTTSTEDVPVSKVPVES